jgi:hypothetical protein
MARRDSADFRISEAHLQCLFVGPYMPCGVCLKTPRELKTSYTPFAVHLAATDVVEAYVVCDPCFVAHGKDEDRVGPVVESNAKDVPRTRAPGTSVVFVGQPFDVNLSVIEGGAP